ERVPGKAGLPDPDERRAARIERLVQVLRRGLAAAGLLRRHAEAEPPADPLQELRLRALPEMAASDLEEGVPAHLEEEVAGADAAADAEEHLLGVGPSRLGRGDADVGEDVGEARRLVVLAAEPGELLRRRRLRRRGRLRLGRRRRLRR